MEAIESLRHSSIVYLTTIGRKTEKPRRVELWFAFDGAEVYFLAHKESQWWRNIS